MIKWLFTIAALILWSTASLAGNADSSDTETRRVRHFPVKESYREAAPPSQLSFEFGFGLEYNSGYDIFKPHYFGMSANLSVGVNIGRRASILPTLEVFHFRNQRVEIRGHPALVGKTALAPEIIFRYTAIPIASRSGLFVQAGGGIFMKLESGQKSYFLLHYGLGIKFPINRNSSMFVLIRHSGYRDGAAWWDFIPITMGFVF